MIMKTVGFGLHVWSILLAASLGAATVKFEVTELDTPTTGSDTPGENGVTASWQRYTYYLSDIVLQRDQELNVRFDPALFGTLSNAKGAPGFDLLLFQPNQPVGASGDFSAFAMVDQTASTASFSVDFLYFGPGISGPQPFFINQFDASGEFRTLEAGVTSPAFPAQVPEPGTLALCGAALLVCGTWRIARR